MNQLLVGSINFSKLVDMAKKGHTAFSKSAKDGNIYMNFAAWVNDEANEFGQHMSLQLSSNKDMKEKEGKIYFGNAKRFDTSQPVTSKDVQDNFDNIPVRQKSEHTIVEKQDDLPF